MPGQVGRRDFGLDLWDVAQLMPTLRASIANDELIDRTSEH